MPSCGIGLGLPYAGTGIDPDALSYFSRAGISSAAQTPTTFQNASTFNGTNHSLSVADNASLRLNGTDFTVSAWVRPSAITANHNIFSKGVEYVFQYSNGGGVRLAYQTAGVWTSFIGPNPSLNSWSFVTFTLSGTTLTTYVNGSAAATHTVTLPSPSSAAAIIGNDSTPASGWNGSLASIGLWKRALSASEVTALFNSGSGRTYASLDSSIRTNMVSWWDLSETSGNRADSFGSNTLTNNNSVGTTSQGAVVTGTADSRALILDFVKGVKALGLWNSFVCWPLRSSQNAGTGTTAFSLGGLGTFNGTLVPGFPWGVNGLVKSAPAMELQLPTNSTITNATTFILLYKADGPTGYSQLRPFVLGACTNTADTGTQSFYNTDNSTTSYRNIRGGAFASTSNTSFTGRAFDFNFVLGSSGNSSALTKVNNSAANIQSFANPRNTQAASTNVLGVNSGPYALNGSALGIYPFFSVLTSEINDTQATSLYNLYKSTLGVGLGLP